MPNKCDECGQEFYSDVEYAQHRDMHEFLKSLKDINAENTVGFSWIAGQLRLMGILQIAKNESIGFAEAITKYHEYWDILGKALEERGRA